MKTNLFVAFLLAIAQLTAQAQGAIWRDVPAGELGGVAVTDLMGRVRASMDYANKYGFGAGIPTFYNGEKNGQIVYGTVLLAKSAVEFKDIPVTELGNVSLTDYQERVRQAMTWATNHGYGAGIPTFYHADHGRGMVCGVMLVKPEAIKFVDVSSLRNVRPFDRADTADWARVAGDWAAKNGYVGAMPTYHVGRDNVFGVVCFKK
ncbi:hypothetical protein ACAW74_08425 [Fibrella sp. WM1]|uniref:hypothetical protein n=1 Tax=Fibrella musci TaxID=3242485 RepID=UPI003521C0F3